MYETMHTNLTWNDDGIWKGWTYSITKNLYHFNDVGNKSLIGLWEDQWKRESDH
jgi:hypothetical protein